ncbi:hypothetical protein [Ferruginibacter sp. HRS2-29]|uniref:hypothetical protein n=1 Tax=Ferruginibacter sp. HRS2-29 TaxID=2487334 RepID=UPI0020CDCE23|nr:hypothetical protein [Ferruginibacter sp. HRS2-29]
MFSQEQNKFILFPKEDIEITQALHPSNSIPLYSFTAKLPEGNAVDFGRDATNYQIDPNGSSSTRNLWQIKTIRNIYNDSITYNYESYNYWSYKMFGQTYEFHSAQASNPPSTTVSKINYYDTRLQSINFPGGVINFYTISRDDMPTKALDEITVQNTEGVIVKRIKFYYSYFYGNNYDVLPMVNSTANGNIPSGYKFQRLKLDSVSMGVGQNLPVRYRFNYYTNNPLPSKYTFSQDHWGFYNGIANTSANSYLPNIIPQLFTGGDRRVKPDYSNAFALKSITYPEGGKTELVYENNLTGVWNTPQYLMDMYQDDNLVNKFSAMTISSYSRSTSNPAPTYTDANGTRFFKKQFTVANGFVMDGFGWQCSTNFGISSLETTMPYNTNNVTFKLELIGSGGTRTTIKEWNNTQNISPYTRTSSNNQSIALRAGNYEMTVALVYANPVGSAAENQPYNLYFNLYWRELNPATNALYAGGLRIKDINYYSSEGILAKKKSYSYTNPYADANLPNFTSGRAITFPNYYQKKIVIKTPPDVTDFIEFFSSNSIDPLETTGGGYSGYEYVDEYDIDYNNPSNNMRTGYHFSFNMPYFGQLYNYIGRAITEPQEWMRGKLLYKYSYKNNTIIRKEDYAYYDWSPHLSNGTNEDYVQDINTDLISFQYFQRIMNQAGSNNITYYQADFYDVNNDCMYWYYGADDYTQTNPPGELFCNNAVHVPYVLHYTAFDKPKTKTITTIDDNNNSIVQTENYFYDRTPNLHQLTRSETNNSLNQTIKSETKYPFDFSTTSPYNTMLTRHILNTPVEQLNSKGSLLMNASRTNFFDWGNNIIAPLDIQQKFLTNAYEYRMRFTSYDTKGNLLAANKESDQKVNYIWDYAKMYPVAEISNSQNGIFAYTSFETTETGNWAYSGTPVVNTTAITGKKVYTFNGSNSISKTGLTSANSYIVSYWTNTGAALSIAGTQAGFPLQGRTVAGWTYFEHQVTGQTQVSLSATSGSIDEVRLYPLNARMMTYTYTPLVGMSSQCDANNRISYYEYDAVNRLTLIRDQDKNILKKICYNYAGQPIDCSSPCVNTSPSWQNTTDPLRCQTNSCGNTGYQEQKQQDVNICSPTYGQYQWVTAGNNPSVCVPVAGINISYSNTDNIAGYVAVYTNTSTNVVTTFTIPSGTGTLGCLPSGIYTVDIHKVSGIAPFLAISCGATTVTGTSAIFNNVNIGRISSRSISISYNAL